MTDNLHVYTSITSNYLPKARVLAHSVKAVMPEATFDLLLSDDLPAGFSLDDEPFDNVIYADSLPVDNMTGWLFGHTVVELCTAVKGFGAEAIFERFNADKVIYFDPDMAVFSRLDELCRELDSASVILTPHQTEPETSIEAIMDNEMASLIYGVFNLGFVGIRNSEEGRRFSRWWTSRLHTFCHDDLVRGLFTDQRWVNLAPCFFDDLKVLRSPAFNVATWNISTRQVDGTFEDGFTVNGEPLGFYHFSGFDSGDQEKMLNKYASGNKALFALRNWYIEQCQGYGQEQLGKLPYKYAHYDDGTPISKNARLLYRSRIDLQQAFPDPFSTQDKGGYKQWYEANCPDNPLEFTSIQISPSAPVSKVIGDMGAYFDYLSCSPKAGAAWRRMALKGVATVFRFVARR